MKGSAMGKKVSLLILSITITLFFLLVGIYELTRAFHETVSGDNLTAAQVAGWISVILFLLAGVCTLLIVKSDHTNL
ncbi:hypothetical protein [Dictyobacter vulcani]|nr:hypothetical protein [Dictyobacter vulcani]